MAVNKRKILEAAQKFLQKGALDKALREYRTLLDLDPRDSGARLKLGDIHLRLGEKDDAVAAYLRVAHQFMKDGFDAKAVALFKQIVKLAPEQIEVHVPLAELYQRLGLIPEAMSALQTAVEAFQKAGRKREALELLRKAASLDPSNTTSRLKIADLLRAQGMNDEALNEYEEVAAELERNAETGGLAGVYERMLELDPERLSALLALSRLSLRESAPERALELAERAASLQPDLMDAVQLHAEVLQAVGRPMEEQEPIWRRLADLHLARGDEAEGRAILQRFCSSYDLTQNGVDLGNAQGEGVALAPDAKVSQPGEFTQAAEKLGPLLPPADDLLFDSPASAGKGTPAALAAAPADADIEQLLAEAGVYLRFGKRERAIASLEAVLAREPDHRVALETLAGAVAREGDVTRARTLLERGASLLEARGDAAGAAQIRVRLAELDPGAAASIEERVLEEPGEAAAIDFDPDGRHAFGEGVGTEIAGAPLGGELADAPLEAEPGSSDIALVVDGESPFELEVELDFSDGDHALPELEAEHPTREAAEPASSLLLEAEQAEALPESQPGPAADGISADGIEFELHEPLSEPLVADAGEVVLELPPEPELELDAGSSADAVGEAPGEDPEALEVDPDEVALEDDPNVLLLDSEVTITGGDANESVADDGPGIIEAAVAGPPSLSSSPKQILEDLEEGDLYFQQHLFADAEAVYRRVLEAAPTNPQALLRLGEIAAARGDDPGMAQGAAADVGETFDAPNLDVDRSESHEPSFGDDLAEWNDETVVEAESAAEAMQSEDLEVEPAADEPLAAAEDAAREISHFDLAAELSEDLEVEEPAAASSPSLAPEAEPSLEAIFSEFKRGVQKTLTPADHETHYDLGIAYREMGLYEDAMSEFRIALESPARRLDCLHLLGLCARDLKRPQDAVAFLGQALADEALEGERRAATLFDLSFALEEAGQAPEAMATLLRLADEAPDHPGLSERLDALRALQSLSPVEPSVEAVPENGEVFESFDDLIADAEAAFATGGPSRPERSREQSRPEPPPDRPSPAPPRGTPPRRRKTSFG